MTEAMTAKVPTVMLIGGSNTGKMDGYTSVLKEALGDERAIRHMLGASTSLYGLSNAKLRDFLSPDNQFIFEYTLNDISYFKSGLYSIGLLERVLSDFCDFSAKNKCLGTFLIMCPRYNLNNYFLNMCPIVSTYKYIASIYGLQYIDATAILANHPDYGPANLNSAYADDMHYTVKAAQIIGLEVLRRISSSRERLDNHPPQRPSVAPLNLMVSDATALNIDGPHESIIRKTSVFEGQGVRLLPSSKAKINVEGCVLGLIASTCEDTGYVKIKSSNRVIYKNMFDAFYSRTSSRIFLKQFARPMQSTLERPLEIHVGISSDSFSSVDLEPTMHEDAPLVSLEKTALEVLGVVWTPSFG